jgi:hypothetical protein
MSEPPGGRRTARWLSGEGGGTESRHRANLRHLEAAWHSGSIDLSQSPFEQCRPMLLANSMVRAHGYGEGRMDQEFDKALQALAALQIKHGLASILLSIQDGQGDVIATVRQPGRNKFSHYARVHRDTMQIVRLRA